MVRGTFREPPYPDCRRLSRLTAFTETQRLTAGLEPADLFDLHGGVQTRIASAGGKVDVPFPSPPFPSTLLTEGMLVHTLFDELKLDVNELRVGKRQKGDKTSDIIVCFELIKDAENTWAEIQAADAEGRLTRVVLPARARRRTFIPTRRDAKLCLGGPRIGSVWDSLQGIEFDVWGIPDVGPARQYVDHPAKVRASKTYRQDVTVDVLERVNSNEEGDFDWWSVINTRDFEVWRADVMNLPRRWTTTAHVNASWISPAVRTVSEQEDNNEEAQESEDDKAYE
ncbi:hypothetical protein Q8F55_002692 [Vanrija albida]|uniref:Uncharacterized protein n=1 Tax=Vanrija albida TaxID=181172 RepID=A0ABR3QAL3_9TREE